MKPITSFALLCAFAAVAQGAVTDPVGYTTVEISPGIFNLVGVTLQEPVAISGVLDSATSGTVDDADVDFSTLAAGVYILELNDGSGVVQEVTVVDADTLATPEDISGSVTADVTAYSLRPASTINTVFGSDNSKANLLASTDGSTDGADIVWVQTSAGLKQFYYVNIPGTFEGWFDGSDPAGDVVINYADGLYVQTQPGSTATDFVITGEVKKQATSSVLAAGFNLLNAVAPAGLTLGTSGLQNFIAASEDGSETGADIVLVPDLLNPGSFKSYYYVSIPGTLEAWFDGADVADDVPLEGAFFLNNLEGSVKPYKLNGPTIAE